MGLKQIDAPPVATRNFVVTVITILVVAPLMWFLLLDRQPPYSGHVGFVQPEEPRAGDQVEISWKLKTHRICPGTVQREIIDAKNVIWNYDVQPAIRRDQLTQAERLHRSFRLPTGISPGLARYKARTCYVCNPLQTWWPICFDTPEVFFNIRPANE